MNPIQDREDWLNRAARAVCALVLAPDVPESCPTLTDVRISCGFPRGARKGQSKTLPRELSADSTSEIFISPELADPTQILPALTACLIQAAHNAKGWAKGQSALPDAAKIGLHGPSMTTTDTNKGDDLRALFAQIAETLGEYPHAKVLPGRPDGTRLLKVSCHTSCGAVWRASAKWANQMQQCPVCGSAPVHVHNS